MDDPRALSDLERELLELCQAGETTTTLYEEMLESPPDRATVEATLRELVGRGFLAVSRGTYVGERVFEDDWWDLTDAGRMAVGLGPRSRPPSS